MTEQREIKFRRAYFDYKTGAFVGFLYWGPTEGGFSAPGSMSNAQGKYDQQFTGLRDKNNVEIYELHEINHKYRVVFKFNRYILQHISNRDINIEFQHGVEYEITGEYSPLEKD